MFQMWKMLFPILSFSFASDQNLGGGASDDQPDTEEEGNADDEGTEPDDKTPTDVELEGGVKVSQATLDKWAKETYKDRFEAYDNREKWQSENTRRAQELKQLERDAMEFRRLQSDPNYGRSKPDNSYEGQKKAYVEKKKSTFPEVDPRFFESQFEDMWEVSGRRAGETIDPIRQQQGMEWERNFLASHPLLKTGTEQYDRLAQMLKKGYDPEDAYGIIFSKELKDKEFEDRMKARDEEAKRKLKTNRTLSSSTSSKPRNPDEAFERAWDKHGDR